LDQRHCGLGIGDITTLRQTQAAFFLYGGKSFPGLLLAPAITTFSAKSVGIADELGLMKGGHPKLKPGPRNQIHSVEEKHFFRPVWNNYSVNSYLEFH
jgi:hypothetical protein